jgi:hypothetical protein
MPSQAALPTRTVETPFTESASRRRRDLRQAVERPLCRPPRQACLTTDRAPREPPGAQDGYSGSVHHDPGPSKPPPFGLRVPDAGADSLADVTQPRASALRSRHNCQRDTGLPTTRLGGDCVPRPSRSRCLQLDCCSLAGSAAKLRRIEGGGKGPPLGLQPQNVR